jgi:alpha-L-rhamnosidase
MITLALNAAAHAITPQQLRCEYRVNPLGIDELKPRLSWTLASNQPADRQTAYQIVVTAGNQTLWDTGKLASDDTTGIVYNGKPLTTGMRCEWKVKAWDKDDKESAWSQPAFWTMGLLQASDWKAEWIGYDKTRRLIDLPDAPLDGAKWIWHAADSQPTVPACYRLFVSELKLPAIKKAELFALGDNYKVVINTHLVTSGSSCTQTKQTDVTAVLRPGDNSIRVEVWNAVEGRPAFLAKLVITTADGKTITHVTDNSWKSINQPGPNWHDRPLDIKNWPAAAVLGDYGIAPWGRAKIETLFLPPPAYLRTAFRADKAI